MIRSTTYRGEHTFNKTITREVPALVDKTIWIKANEQLKVNTRLPKRADKFRYLLRGLITCTTCGATYNGHQQGERRKAGNRAILLYYRCGTQMGDRQTHHRCNGKMIAADWLEDLVWNDIKKFVMDPGEVLEKLQAQMDMRSEAIPSSEERRHELERLMALKKLEEDRLIDAFRRGTIDLDQLDEQLKSSKAEAIALNDELMNLISKEAETGRAVGDLATTEDLLRTLRMKIDWDLPFETRRTVVEGLVSGITVETQGTGHQKTASVTVSYNFSDPSYAVDNATSRTRIRRQSR